jgi:hypothetical protein
MLRTPAVWIIFALLEDYGRLPGRHRRRPGIASAIACEARPVGGQGERDGTRVQAVRIRQRWSTLCGVFA